MEPLHIFFLPMLAHGHFIPMFRMAERCASRGVKTTTISTAKFTKTINTTSPNVNIITINFPPNESGLPEHIQTIEQGFSTEFLMPKFLKALDLLQEPVENLIKEFNPTCIISDMWFPWSTDSALKFGIPRLNFTVTGFFTVCATEEIMKHKPFKNLSPDDDTTLVQVPNLPHRIMLTRAQVSDISPISDDVVVENDLSRFMERVRDADNRSYGFVFNSFYELEPDYVDHFRKALGQKAWHLGPLSLQEPEQKAQKRRASSSVIDECGCLAWLDSKKPSSVVYVCFGSLVSFTPTQLREIAIGLEASAQDFIWVVRKNLNDEDNNEVVLPEGFGKRMGDRCLIVRGWAPQVDILDHPAIGAFLTHCGWNSCLEGVCAGVPMVTWPCFCEQFVNEKFLIECLKIGISVGNKKSQLPPCEGVLWDAVSLAVQKVMEAETNSRLRSRAMHYKDMARIAIGEDGSSYKELSGLFEELIAYIPPQEGIFVIIYDFDDNPKYIQLDSQTKISLLVDVSNLLFDFEVCFLKIKRQNDSYRPSYHM